MAHKYSTLLHDDSIRLLKLLPTSDIPTDHGLNCGLEDYRLSDDPIYEALSYTWGNPIFPEILNTHSGILRITENLASALRGVRFRGRVRYLWVDAVCINQDDKREKGRQVALMGPIYKSARQVICWLGQEDEDVGDAIENLKRLTAFASRSGLDEVSFSCPIDAAPPTYVFHTMKNINCSIALSQREESRVLRQQESTGRGI